MSIKLSEQCILANALKNTLAEIPDFCLQVVLDSIYSNEKHSPYAFSAFLNENIIKCNINELNALSIQYNCTNYSYKDIARILLPDDVAVQNMCMQFNSHYKVAHQDKSLIFAIFEVYILH